MKSFIKKITLAVCVAAASITLMTANVSATDQPRPMPGTTATETTNKKVEKSSGEQTSSTTQSMAQASVNTTTNKKYLTNLGAFGWFVLSVVVNFILSCWIGNKFYNLARKSSQNSSEIRALRKDIEERFASTLTDIEESSTEIMNRNENYSRTDEGITMPEHRAHTEMNDEEREMMRKWDKRRITQRVIAQEEREAESAYAQYEEETSSPSKRAYQPTRRSSGIEFEDDEYDEYDEYEDVRSNRKTKPLKKDAFSKATNKAKDFLSNVFPFED